MSIRAVPFSISTSHKNKTEESNFHRLATFLPTKELGSFSSSPSSSLFQIPWQTEDTKTYTFSRNQGHTPHNPNQNTAPLYRTLYIPTFCPSITCVLSNTASIYPDSTSKTTLPTRPTARSSSLTRSRQISKSQPSLFTLHFLPNYYLLFWFLRFPLFTSGFLFSSFFSASYFRNRCQLNSRRNGRSPPLFVSSLHCYL